MKVSDLEKLSGCPHRNMKPCAGRGGPDGCMKWVAYQPEEGEAIRTCAEVLAVMLAQQNITEHIRLAAEMGKFQKAVIQGIGGAFELTKVAIEEVRNVEGRNTGGHKDAVHAVEAPQGLEGGRQE